MGAIKVPKKDGELLDVDTLLKSNLNLMNKALKETIPSITNIVVDIDGRLGDLQPKQMNDTELCLDMVTRLCELVKDTLVMVGNQTILSYEIGRMMDKRMPKQSSIIKV